MSDLDRLTYMVPEAAEVLGISERLVYKLLARNALPVVRLGGSVRIPKSALATWLDEQALAGVREQSVLDYLQGGAMEPTAHTPGAIRKSRAKKGTAS